MSVDDIVKNKGFNTPPYFWLDEKPNINDEYMFDDVVPKSKPVHNNKVKKLMEWCLG